MNIQMYVSKKNFDVQKAERFFKERRITVQVMDLKIVDSLIPLIIPVGFLRVHHDDPSYGVCLPFQHF